jgi:lipoprotein-anchoring transpeptidase ErfK/SrfK
VSRHRATQVRPRYGRLGAAAASLTVTLVAVLGGFGLLPSSSGQPDAARPAATGHAQPSDVRTSAAAPTDDASAETTSEPGAAAPASTKGDRKGNGASADATENHAAPREDVALPEGSGKGKRVVFSISRQRVWLVESDGTVARTYLVSGSVYDNLDPGAFNVYSRSQSAWGVEDSGTMKYFVRFTQGDTGAAIGFHDIPVKDGVPLQSEAQLGTPMSHGCIRQKRSDALALWNFAPLGTSVIVTA